MVERESRRPLHWGSRHHTLHPRKVDLASAMAHVCNPSYPGGREQEDGSLKPTQGK
jgi:hypothetical protein